MTGDSDSTDHDGTALVELLRAMDAGDYERAADRTEDFTAADLAGMWSELTDSFGALEEIGEPGFDGSEATVPLELAGQRFVASGRPRDDRIEAFRISLSQDAGTLSVLTGRLRGALSGVLDPLLDADGPQSEAGERLATASDLGERARAAAELLAAERFDELAAILDPPAEADHEDPETVATAVERTWTTKVSSYEGVARIAVDGDSGYAFVDAGDGQVRVEVIVEDGDVCGLLLTSREDVASMVASRVFRGERFEDLPEVLGGDVADSERVASTAERAWTDLLEDHGSVESVGDPSLDGEDAFVVDLATTEGSVRVRVAFDDLWRPSVLRLAGADGTVAWEWERGRSVDDGTAESDRSGAS